MKRFLKFHTMIEKHIEGNLILEDSLLPILCFLQISLFFPTTYRVQ